MVLQNPPHLRRTDDTAGSGRPLQLPRWLRKLAGRLVRGQEGMVLQSPWQGLPKPGRWMYHFWDDLASFRLRRWVRKLDGRLVGCKEGMVLSERRQGVPTSRWRLC